MRNNFFALLVLPLLPACAVSVEAESSAAEQLCRDALGAQEVVWTRLSKAPPQAREILRAAAKGPEGRIAAHVWFVDSRNDVAVCELRNRRFDFARVFEVRANGGQWALKRVHGTPPAIEMPAPVEYTPEPLPQFTVVNQSGGQSYMSLVGELVGTVESLRVLSDYCSTSFPQTSDANKRAYEAWAKRNADLLASVQTQREHADRRLARQAASDPFAPKSTAAVVALLEQSLSAQLRGGNAEAQQSFCVKYPELISSSEKARTAEITSLLKTVTHADKVLSEREKQQGG